MNLALQAALACLPGIFQPQEPPAAQEAPPPQELPKLKERAEELLRRARAAREAGDRESHQKLMGEAAYLLGLITQAEGKFEAAEQHFATARRYGYVPPPREGPPEPAAARPAVAPRPSIPEAPNSFGPPRSLWDHYRFAPYPTTRNNGYHALVHVPPMDQPRTLPEYTFSLRIGADYDTADIRTTSEGGTTRYNGRHHSEIFEFNYGAVPDLEVGARLILGETRAASSTTSTVFEAGGQIVRTGRRNYAVESVTLRVKVRHDLFEAVETGLLAELKIPLDGTTDLLTADSLDFGLSMLTTCRWDNFAVHLNFGGVFPIGDASDIFIANDELQPFAAYGLGLVYTDERVAVGLQFEGNTSPFREISVLKDPVGQFVGHAHFAIDDDVIFGVAAGAGISEFSSDLYVSIGLTFTY
jgi:hypothetical protein